MTNQSELHEQVYGVLKRIEAERAKLKEGKQYEQRNQI